MRYRFIVGIALLVILFIIMASCFSKTGAISLENDNMAIVRLSICAFGEGDWSCFARLHSPAYIQHAPDFKDPISWPAYELGCRSAYDHLPDLQFRIEDIFAVKDKVAVRCTWHYLADSIWFKIWFPDGVAQGSEISIYRIEDGKIIEEWIEYDTVGIQRLVSFKKSLEHME